MAASDMMDAAEYTRLVHLVFAATFRRVQVALGEMERASATGCPYPKEVVPREGRLCAALTPGYRPSDTTGMRRLASVRIVLPDRHDLYIDAGTALDDVQGALHLACVRCGVTAEEILLVLDDLERCVAMLDEAVLLLVPPEDPAIEAAAVESFRARIARAAAEKEASRGGK